MNTTSSLSPVKLQGPDALDEAVDIWMMKTDFASEHQRDLYLTVLSDDEKIRYARYKTSAARDQFLAARVLLRKMLSSYVDVPPESWRFGTSFYGKPHIAFPAEKQLLHFNVSHTSGMAACAVSTRYALGVDIESLRSTIQPLPLAKQFFAREEYTAISECPIEEQMDCFFSIWTLKEAYIKARGCGLSLPLHTFWFDLRETEPAVCFSSQCEDSAENWQFFRNDVTEDHKLALAVLASANRMLKYRIRWISPHALIIPPED